MRSALAGLLILACSVMLAAPAQAGEHIEGSGWELVLPDGFVEALSMEGGGKFNMASRFGTLPVEGVPEIKAFIAGDESMPSGVIVITKIALTKSVETSDELGMKDVDKIREQLPDDVSIAATTVGEYGAIEMRFGGDAMDDEQTSHVLAIACGDYVVVIMMMTQDEDYPSPDAMWSALKSTVKIDPPMNKLLLFGLIGFGAMGALWLLNRVGTRQVHNIPEHSGRFRGSPDSADLGSGALGGLEQYTPVKTGVRPSRLPSSRPKFEGEAGAPPPMGRPMSAPAQAPSEPQAAPAAARSEAAKAQAPSGLRSTRRATGRWGD